MFDLKNIKLIRDNNLRVEVKYIINNPGSLYCEIGLEIKVVEDVNNGKYSGVSKFVELTKDENINYSVLTTELNRLIMELLNED